MAATKPTLAIRNVTVIAMTDAAPLAQATVIVEDGRIAAIGPTDELEIPAGARVIEGTGRYLLPGMIDMHVHIVPHICMPREGGDAIETSLDMAGEYLALFARFGVTTVRCMAGSDFLLKVRGEAAAGRYPSPRIYSSGPIIEQHFSWAGIATYAKKVDDPAQARDEVRRQKDVGYDCLKIYNNISVEIFEALMDEARAQGMHIGGHVPFPVGLFGALKAGMDTIEHLRAFDSYLDTRPFHRRANEWPGDIYSGWRHTDADTIVELAEIVAQYPHTGQVATMMVENPECADIVYPDELMEQIPWSVKQHLEGLHSDLPFTPQQRSDVRAGQFTRRQMLLELDNRDVPLLTGSDCPGARTRLIPGYSMIQEVEAFVASGIAPLRALKAATVAPARNFGIFNEVGTIEVGKTADMILLEANPLANISALRRQAGVFLEGTWYETGAKGTADLLRWRERAGHEVATSPVACGPVKRGMRPVLA